MTRRLVVSCQSSVVRCSQQRTTSSKPALTTLPSALRLPPSAFTLVEMLVAMAITLVMMGAVVTLFANVSNSVRDRRATIEMSGQLRHARNMLQQDLQGATCPGLTWRRPEENQGYIEIIEGPYREGNASHYSIDRRSSTTDRAESGNRSHNFDHSDEQFAIGHDRQDKWVTDGAGLGDGDDILMLTVRNEHEPFVGNMPDSADVRPNATNATTMGFWKNVKTIESPLGGGRLVRRRKPGLTTTSPNQFLRRTGHADDLSSHAADRSLGQSLSLHGSDTTGVVNDTFTTGWPDVYRASRDWCEFCRRAFRRTRRSPA